MHLWIVSLLGLFSCSTPARETVRPVPTLPRSSTWVDVVAGQTWAVSATEVKWSTANSLCVSPWRTPSAGEYSGAWGRGLTGGLVWGISVASDQALTYDLREGHLDIMDKHNTAGTACVRESTNG